MTFTILSLWFLIGSLYALVADMSLMTHEKPWYTMLIVFGPIGLGAEYVYRGISKLIES